MVRLSMIKPGLTFKIIIAIVLGVLLGVMGGDQPYFGGLQNAALGKLGLMIIRFIKGLAVPLIFFAVTNTLVKTQLSKRSGLRFLTICLFNSTIAAILGLSILNFWGSDPNHQAGIRQVFEKILETPKAPAAETLAQHGINLLDGISNLLPPNFIDPIQNNNVIATVVLAILVGSAIRGLKASTQGEESVAVKTLEHLIQGGFLVLSRVLRISIEIVPLAVLGLVAQAVGKAGIGLFLDLGDFLMITVLGLAIQALIYYPLAAFLMTGRSPSSFLKDSSEAVIMAAGVNSSLATVPVTLQCLKRMKVAEQPAFVSVCGGSNFNNDGIVLYEIMAAIFLAQAIGMPMDLAQQGLVMVSSILAAIGIAGVPEAGMIILPIVLSSTGFSETTIAAAIPLIAPVDWIIGRCRSAVNVLGDILGACLLDRWDHQDTPSLRQQESTKT